jgi:uncharacterized protein YndB with AHSA1/START domain
MKGKKRIAVMKGGKKAPNRQAKVPPKKGSKVFTITRVFNASRQRVFQAWTEPERIARWFGPKGISIKSANLDLRPGGSLLTCMANPDGQEMWGKWVFRKIAAPRKLVYVNSFSDPQGHLTRHPHQPNWPLELLTTVILADQKGKTKLTLTWSPENAVGVENQTFEDGMASMQGGWTGTFDQLEAYLAQSGQGGKP